MGTIEHIERHELQIKQKMIYMPVYLAALQ